MCRLLEEIVTDGIKSHLKKQTKCNTHVNIVDDTCVIQFFMLGEQLFEYRYYNFIEDVKAGRSSWQIADKALEAFRRKIFYKYFR